MNKQDKVENLKKFLTITSEIIDEIFKQNPDYKNLCVNEEAIDQLNEYKRGIFRPDEEVMKQSPFDGESETIDIYPIFNRNVDYLLELSDEDFTLEYDKIRCELFFAIEEVESFETNERRKFHQSIVTKKQANESLRDTSAAFFKEDFTLKELKDQLPRNPRQTPSKQDETPFPDFLMDEEIEHEEPRKQEAEAIGGRFQYQKEKLKESERNFESQIKKDWEKFKEEFETKEKEEKEGIKRPEAVGLFDFKRTK